MLEGEDETKNKKKQETCQFWSTVPTLTNKQGETITDTKGKA